MYSKKLKEGGEGGRLVKGPWNNVSPRVIEPEATWLTREDLKC